jgi:ATP-dependent helicase STH1/SNF2
VFESDSDFDQWFESPFGEEKTEMTHEEKTLIILRLHKVLAPFMLRRVKLRYFVFVFFFKFHTFRSDVASDLPDVIERTLACEFSELQILMSQFVKRGEIPALPAPENQTSGSGQRKMPNMASSVGGNNLLRKVCNHPFLV